MFTKLGKIKIGDFYRGLIVAILSAPIGILYDWATMVNFELNWKSLVKGAVAGGLAYLMKNLLTGENGNFLRNS